MNGFGQAGGTVVVDALVAEIGSTTTLVSACAGLRTGRARLLGQGEAPTTAEQGDVMFGVEAALDDLRARMAACQVQWEETYASSSAAGGLKMTVHGLVYDMTARAAQEAALGAGAIVRLVTAGKLRAADLEKMREIKPRIVLLAGGVDYGETETALFNAEEIVRAGLHVPVVYAGNTACRDEVREILHRAGLEVWVVENVYPRVDELNVEPARKAIQEVFEREITVAPGMGRIREMVGGPIMPTPGAVMNAARLLYEQIGDLVVIDVGGATTDVHSVTPGREDAGDVVVRPEPFAKRTVEGDLGVFVNARHVAEMAGKERLGRELGFDVLAGIERLTPFPSSDRDVRLVAVLAREAVSVAVRRHAGRMKKIFGAIGPRIMVEGRDLTQVKWIVGTGGPLTRLAEARAILEGIKVADVAEFLLPGPDARVLIDRDYVMAPAGVLAARYPRSAVELVMASLGLGCGEANGGWRYPARE